MIKMKPGESLKYYVSYFQNQIALIMTWLRVHQWVASFPLFLQTLREIESHQDEGHPLSGSEVHLGRGCDEERSRSLFQGEWGEKRKPKSAFPIKNQNWPSNAINKQTTPHRTPRSPAERRLTSHHSRSPPILFSAPSKTNCGGNFPPQTIWRSRLILTKTQKRKEYLSGEEHRCGTDRIP